MSLNIPDWFVSTFSTNVMLKLQIMGSQLRGTVTEGFHQGKQASPVDQISSINMLEVTGRFQPMPRVDAVLDRRWVTPKDFDLPQLIDSFDKLRILTDPEGIYVRNAVLAAGRTIDEVIIASFMGTAKTGESGAGTTSFTAGNEVDVAVGGANSALNVPKLLAVKKLMRQNFIDFDQEEVYLGLTAVDEAALLNEIQIISSDFNGGDKPVLKDGKLTRFLGINFVYCELIETKAAGTNEVNIPVWVKSGIHLGIWGDVTTSISKRNDIRSEPWQSYVTGTFGATRLEEGKVFNIESYRP